MDVGVHEAKTHLSRLLRRVAEGEEITIRRGGEVVAKIVPAGVAGRRDFGVDEGVFEVPDDFDDPLPADVLDLFQR